jgi:hypothetical protein
MGKKTRAELEAELKTLRRTRLASSITEIIQTLIRFGALVACVYFLSTAISNLAGKSTIADIGVKFLGNVDVGRGVAVLFGAGGTLYGLAERRQRQKIIKRLHGRTKEVEKKIDPQRSSSGLTETGDTNPNDE